MDETCERKTVTPGRCKVCYFNVAVSFSAALRPEHQRFFRTLLLVILRLECDILMYKVYNFGRFGVFQFNLEEISGANTFDEG